tara:strand:- start:194 stop:799 length:606 start_codon:yes stop_codon:yes gene_type:complete
MGFDLYGLNPINPNNIVKPKHFDWDDKNVTQKEKDAYYKAAEEYDEQVVGSYFRNNVWFWRPLWQYVSIGCGNILTENDIMEGSSNSGHTISKTKAKRIAARLRRLDKDGMLSEYDKFMNKKVKKARKNNKKVRELRDELQKKAKKELGPDIIPADYPEPYKTEWDKIYEMEDWTGHYPFDVDNVRNFAEFCENSGGFEIC